MLISVPLCAGTLASTEAATPFAAGITPNRFWTSCSASSTGRSPTTITAMLSGRYHFW